jgi:hypothetical protein
MTYGMDEYTGKSGFFQNIFISEYSVPIFYCAFMIERYVKCFCF